MLSWPWATVLSRDRSKAVVLEGAMALVEEAQSADAEVLAKIMVFTCDVECQAASESAA